MGQLDVLRILHLKGADLFRTDANGDSGVHWAARQGHCDVIEFLRQHSLSLNASNKFGDTPLHLASKQGHPAAVELLFKYSSDVNQPNEEGDTALHLAAVKGHLVTARCLTNAGANPDIRNKHGCTALHLALYKHHTAVAIMLLQGGCNIEILDNLGEAAIHIVAREGLLSMAQTLCAFGCKVEIQNLAGQYPLHIAARNGHTELVRCLCLAGCDVELRNKDGIEAEICALAQGYNEMAELLNKLRNAQLREEFIAQLIPSTRPISKIKLKLFGHSGVGKTTFLESLKCGYFTSWLKRSVVSMSPTLSKNRKGNTGNKSVIELNSSASTKNELCFDTCFETYTRGIDVQNVNISGIGNVSLWEFSGHEPYYMTYDNLIGNTNCVHLVFFSLNDEYEIQLQQVQYWLAFLQSRIPVQEPLGYCGKSGKPARVILVATHADATSCHKVAATGEFVSSEASSVLRAAQIKFGTIFDLHDSVFILDAQVVGSPGLKALKAHIVQCKEKVTQGLPKSTGFLEAACSQLPCWRKSRNTFPSMPWKDFIDLVHSNVNPLAGEEHMKELIQQLQIMGEVLYITCDTEDIVILNPAWLCVDIIGHLLSQENLDKARVTGIYSADDIQLLFPEADAQKLLPVLEALQLCTKCEAEDDVEYEFPCFNVMEKVEGIWNASPSQFSCYGGVRLTCKYKHLLESIFSKVQVSLRRLSKEHVDMENDLYQWCQGSKFCCGRLESVVVVNNTAYDVKVRGPGSFKTECFFFQEDLINVIEQVFADVCPGLLLERHVYSSSQLQAHEKFPFTYSPTLLMKTLIKDGISGTVTNEQRGNKETMVSILFYGNSEILGCSKHFLPKVLSSSNRSAMPRSRTFSALVHQNQMNHSHSHQRRQSLPHNVYSSQLPQDICCRHQDRFDNVDQKSKTRQRTQSLPQNIYNQNRDSFFRLQRDVCCNNHQNGPAELPLHQNIILLVPDLHASQLPLLSTQCLCAVLDPQDSMGQDWCMLGVLLGMTEKLPKIDPGDNPAFSPTACILNEWMKSEDNMLGQLLLKLQELQRSDASESIMPNLPLFRIEQLSLSVYNDMFHNFKE